MGVNENVAAKYDAFISYRHSELDKFVAQTLQRKLENYKVPKSVLKGKNLSKTKINRIFRDQDELPLASNLSEPIEAALKVSDFLIVICSPRLPLSEWCKKEIDTFIELNGREKVLAVLCEGEPVESFPEALIKEKVVTIDENGNEIITEKNIEPLAADVRGKSKKEIVKMIDDAVLRITAAILGINYDDLKQRHKEQKFKRMLTISAAIAAFFIVFSLVSTFLLIKIKNQSNQIMEQNTQIIDKNNQITAQSEQIREQYVESKKKLAASYSSTAYTLMTEGRRKDALYAVLQAAPDNKAGTDDKPYISEIERMLVETVQPYASPYSYVPENSFVVENGVSHFTTSEDGKYLAIVDKQYNLVVYDTESLERIFDNAKCDYIEERLFFINKETLFFSNDEGAHVLALNPVKVTDLEASMCDAALSPDKDRFMVTDFNNVYVYDANSLERIYSASRGESAILSRTFYIDDDIVCDCLEEIDSDTAILKGISVTEDKILWEMKMTGTNGGKFAVDDKYLYICGSVYGETLNKVTTYIYCIDKFSGKVIWTSANEDIYVLDMKAKVTDEGTIIVANSTAKLYAIDGKSGKMLLNKNTNEKIVSTFWTKDSPIIAAMTSDGLTNVYYEDDKYEGVLDYFAIDTEIGMSDVSIRPSMLFATFKNKNYISLYKLPGDGNYTILDEYTEPETEQPVKKATYDKEGIKLFEGESEEPYDTYEMKTYNTSNVILSKDGRYVFVESWDGQISIIDINEKKLVKTLYNNVNSGLNSAEYDENLNAYIVIGSRSYILNSEFEIISELGNVKEYNSDTKKFIIKEHGSYVEYEYMEYEALVQRAKEILGDYVPDNEIKVKYNMN